MTAETYQAVIRMVCFRCGQPEHEGKHWPIESMSGYRTADGELVVSKTTEPAWGHRYEPGELHRR